MKLGEDMPEDKMDKLLEEQGAAAGPDRRGQRVGARPPGRDGDGRAALPAGRRRRHEDLRRREAPRRAVPAAAVASPTCCCSTSRPTTSTPRASRGSRSTLEDFKGTVVAITHDRYFLDNVAKWILELDRGEGHPFEGNYTGWLELKAKRLQGRGEARPTRARRCSRASSSGCGCRRRRARPRARRASTATTRWSPRRRRRSARSVARDRDPAGPAPRRRGRRVRRRVSKAFGDRLLIDDLTFKLPRGGIVGVIGPNGAGKTTLFRMIMGVEKPDKGTIKVGETVQARLRRPVARRARRRQDDLRGDQRGRRHHAARRALDQRARVRVELQLQGPGPAEAGRHPVGRRAQPRAPREDDQARRQRAAARRAVERPRRRHAARARGRPR